MRAEQAVMNPVEVIQDQLGIDEAAAADFASIEIKCPGADEGSSLGDFMTSEHGVKKGAMAIVEKVAAEAKKGLSHEEALIKTLGTLSVVQDPETGALARVTPIESRPLESKKK